MSLMAQRRLGGGVSADGGVLGGVCVLCVSASTSSAIRGSIVAEFSGREKVCERDATQEQICAIEDAFLYRSVIRRI